MRKPPKHKPGIKEMEAMPDDAIDYTDIPRLDDQFWENAIVQLPETKQRLTVRFDADMVKWFKSQGRGYQTKMNAVLRSFYESQKHR